MPEHLLRVRQRIWWTCRVLRSSRGASPQGLRRTKRGLGVISVWALCSGKVSFSQGRPHTGSLSPGGTPGLAAEYYNSSSPTHANPNMWEFHPVISPGHIVRSFLTFEGLNGKISQSQVSEISCVSLIPYNRNPERRKRNKEPTSLVLSLCPSEPTASSPPTRVGKDLNTAIMTSCIGYIFPFEIKVLFH